MDDKNRGVAETPVAWGVRFPTGDIVPVGDRADAEVMCEKGNLRFAAAGVAERIVLVGLVVAETPGGDGIPVAWADSTLDDLKPSGMLIFGVPVERLNRRSMLAAFRVLGNELQYVRKREDSRSAFRSPVCNEVCPSRPVG